MRLPEREDAVEQEAMGVPASNLQHQSLSMKLSRNVG